MAVVHSTDFIPGTASSTKRSDFVASRSGAFQVRIEKAYDAPVKNQAKNPGGLNFVCETTVLGGEDDGMELRTYTFFTGETSNGHPRANELNRPAVSAGLTRADYTVDGGAIDTALLAEKIVGRTAYVWVEETKTDRGYINSRIEKYLTPAEYAQLEAGGTLSKPLSEEAQAYRNGGRVQPNDVDFSSDVPF